MTRRAEGWPAQVTGAIGRAVRQHRDERGWSGDRLIAELDDVGLKMTRAALTNLEAGRRETVGVHEVYALAAVLGVPPLSLLVPDLGTDVTILPDLTVDAVRTVGWITGTHLDYRMAFMTDDDHSDPHDRYKQAAEPFAELREHDVLANDLMQIATVGRSGDLVDIYRQRLGRLRRFRDRLRGRGWAEPPIPDGLDVDTWHDVATTQPKET